MKTWNASIISSVLLLSFYACSSGSLNKAETSTLQTSDSQVQFQGDSWRQILAGKEPLSKNVLYKLFPEKLGDMPLIEITDNPGTNGAIGSYGNEKETSHKSQHITLKIIDGAGYGFQHINAVYRMIESNNAEENNTGWSRIEDRNGMKMIVQQKTSGEKLYSGISFIKDQRYHITIEGSRLAADALYSPADLILEMNYPK